jgi:hypothetical protein
MLRLLKLLAILLATSLWGSVYDFDLIKKGKEDSNTPLVGGIQGDESGGFLSASLLATHKENIPSCFSIDTKDKVYRVEYYKNNTFAGMLLVKFV